MKKIKPIIVMLIALSIIFTTQNAYAKTYKTYTSQLTKSEKKLKNKLVKKLKKSPQNKTFTITKTYKKRTSYSTMNKRAIKALRKFTRVLTATTLDYPEFYWIGNDNSYLFKYSPKKYIIKCTFDSRFNHSKKTIKKFKSSINNIVSTIKKKNPKSKENKVKAINSWLCKNVDYSLSSENSYNAYGAAVNKRAVCDGISSLFKLLCKKFGISCFKERGKGLLRNGSYQNHAWNVVYVNSKWLGVDSTWNNTTKKEDYNLLQPKLTFIKNHKKMIENGSVEGFNINGKKFTFKALKSPF